MPRPRELCGPRPLGVCRVPLLLPLLKHELSHVHGRIGELWAVVQALSPPQPRWLLWLSFRPSGGRRCRFRAAHTGPLVPPGQLGLKQWGIGFLRAPLLQKHCQALLRRENVGLVDDRPVRVDVVRLEDEISALFHGLPDVLFLPVCRGGGLVQDGDEKPENLELLGRELVEQEPEHEVARLVLGNAQRREEGLVLDPRHERVLELSQELLHQREGVPQAILGKGGVPDLPELLLARLSLLEQAQVGELVKEERVDLIDLVAVHCAEGVRHGRVLSIHSVQNVLQNLRGQEQSRRVVGGQALAALASQQGRWTRSASSLLKASKETSFRFSRMLFMVIPGDRVSARCNQYSRPSPLEASSSSINRRRRRIRAFPSRSALPPSRVSLLLARCLAPLFAFQTPLAPPLLIVGR